MSLNLPLVSPNARRSSSARDQVRYPFDNYFSKESIIYELCRARIKLAERRDEALYFHNIDRSQPSAEEIQADWGDIPPDIFPPRNAWHHYRPRHRATEVETNLEPLLRAVRHLQRETPQAGWVRTLNDTVDMIRCRVLCERPFQFSAPTVRPQPKNSVKHTYRPVASFCLSDKIIDCLTARYLRESLDPSLLDCSFAFRARKWGRNEAMDIILRMRQRHQPLFVAECDIMSFYDSVSHTVARDALKELIGDAEHRDATLYIDARATEIFEAFLSSYSFLRNIQQGAEFELKSRRGSEAHYPWPEAELRVFHGSDLDGIGVPQGGALSGVIANAVLHVADKEMMPVCRKVTYLRYCDDMILLATDRAAVEDAFSAYRAAVNRLKLPIDVPERLQPYCGAGKRSFWGTKSKGPYRWADPQQPDAYPWIQFLGYQIRHDGVVRVRQSSINKELTKQIQITGRLLHSLRSDNVSNIRRSPSAIVHSFKLKLISMGVGRREFWQPLTGPMPKCWAAGFRWLSGKHSIINNLRALDRQREQQINRVMRRLKGLDIATADARPRRRRYGFPFSYVGQFLDKPSAQKGSSEAE